MSQIIGVVLLIVSAIALIYIQIQLKKNYPSSLDKKRKRDMWNLYGAPYIFTYAIPYYTESKDEKEQVKSEEFNKYVKLFWWNFVLVGIGGLFLSL